MRSVVHPPRGISIALRGKLKAEPTRMTEIGVIKHVTEPTDWVSSLVVVDSLKVCLDPRDLNQAIKREHYCIPTTEDILSQISGVKFFKN